MWSLYYELDDARRAVKILREAIKPFAELNDFYDVIKNSDVEAARKALEETASIPDAPYALLDKRG